MKKSISILLIITMCVYLFTSCVKEKRVVYEYKTSILAEFSKDQNNFEEKAKLSDMIVRGKANKIAGSRFEKESKKFYNTVQFKCSEVLKGDKTKSNIELKALSEYVPSYQFGKYAKDINPTTTEFHKLRWVDKTLGYVQQTHLLNEHPSKFLNEETEYILYLNQIEDTNKYGISPYFGGFEIKENDAVYFWGNRYSLNHVYTRIETAIQQKAA